jgi:hypothetical protein
VKHPVELGIVMGSRPNEIIPSGRRHPKHAVSDDATITSSVSEDNSMKAPYRNLFSNDTTNIEQCTSAYSPLPWRHKGPAKPFSKQMLEASVDETVGTGVDAHLLQPGVGWVPWWKSKKYPFPDHMKFMKERFGKDPSTSGFALFMANGGDIVQVFVDHCRAKGIAPFISFRLNDSHGHEIVNAAPETVEGWAWHVVTPWHVNHPEWRIGQDLNNWDNRVLNWAIPAVRQHKFDFIREIIEQYDIDGFELDFMRHNNFFRPNETPVAERRKIMLEFVRDVRALLDRTSKPGQRRWLCVRIPGRLNRHDHIGVDVDAFHMAGVDMFNLCSSFFTEQQSDMAEVVRRLPQASVYLECTSAASLGKFLGGYDQSFRRMTDEQFYTAGHLAYSRGAAGISTFNFVYYRQHHDNEKIGPFSEPPFRVFKGLVDPAFLAKQPQHYFLPSLHGGGILPHPMQVGETFTIDIDMSPPTGGWRKDGRLRIQADDELGNSQWQAKVNGTELTVVDDVSEPYPNPYPNCLGHAKLFRAWRVPATVPRDGLNTVTVTIAKGEKPEKVIFLDLAMP